MTPELGKGTAHDLLARDLVYHLTMKSGIQGRLIAAPEVTIDDTRWDVVAVGLGASPAAFAFEVKTSLSDARDWIRSRKWEHLVAHNAIPVLAYPESLGLAWDERPAGVYALRKLDIGSWEPLRFGPSLGKPSADLLLGVLHSLRLHAFYTGHIAALGESMSAALARCGNEES